VDEMHGLTAVLGGATASERVEDTSIVSLRSDDVLGCIALSWKTPPWEGLVEVVSSAGRARVEYEGDRTSLKLRTGNGPWRAVRTPRASRFVYQMRGFLAGVRGVEKAPGASARDGLEATRIVLRIYEEA